MLTTVHGLDGDEWEIQRMRRRPRETSTNATKVRAVFGDSPRKELKIPKVVDDYNYNMGGRETIKLTKSSEKILPGVSSTQFTSTPDLNEQNK
ncbi:hypothetical protein FBU30_003101 [Linnemannia zychae]|nr:hypothetical protein FBU30_003101 [Linnemannia zychae]